MSDSSIALKRKPGRPKLPIDRRMQFLSIQIPPEVRRDLDLLSVQCDKSISALAREALNLIVYVYTQKEKCDGKQYISC